MHVTISQINYIYKQDNSKRWYARFVLAGKWHSRTTKQKDKDQAITVANQIFAENKFKLKHNIPVHLKRFRHVAELARQRMKDELKQGIGPAANKDYLGALKKYHIEYFDSTYISSIDQQMLTDFNEWRTKEAKKQLTHSTILTHNAAMQRVFEEAVLHKWLLPSQVPILKNNGVQGKRRSAFTKEEFAQLIDGYGDWLKSSIKERTRNIRELLYDYIIFAIHTGIRPGVEIDHLTFGDLKYKKEKGQTFLLITVRKGKTTKFTGTRTIVCQLGAMATINNIKNRLGNIKDTDRIFRCHDGLPTKELGRAFNSLLIATGLKTDANGTRTLYSLRHSYITWHLEIGTNIHVVAKQCGNSAKTIEENYNHLVPEMHTELLSGINDQELIDLSANVLGNRYIETDGDNFWDDPNFMQKFIDGNSTN